ncbi:MAG: hypothetical protein GX951_01595 [Mollicutes bacterium]|nr:hypothetical protein [Mollicutes bacterium]
MKKLKTGNTFIIIGNVLNLFSSLFGDIGMKIFKDFFQGLLVGMSTGLNVIGIILILIYWSKTEKKE